MTTPTRILAITAHPDDADYFFSGTIARWSAAGATVTYAVATDGECGRVPPGNDAAALAATRRAEQEHAAAAVGVRTVHFLGYPDAALADTPALRRDLVALIRRTQPQIVVSLDPTSWFLEGRINHPDHRALGAAVVAAVWPACNNALCFPELLEEGLAPHKVDELWLSATHEPDHSVEITDTFDCKVAALACNQSQLDPGEDVQAMLRRAFGHTGATGETVYLEQFRVLHL